MRPVKATTTSFFEKIDLKHLYRIAGDLNLSIPILLGGPQPTKSPKPLHILGQSLSKFGTFKKGRTGHHAMKIIRHTLLTDGFIHRANN